MKKIIKTLSILLAACFTFCGCMNNNYNNIEGYPDVSNAKKLFSELDSGHFYMQDNTTGQKTEEFTFMYNQNGNLVYSHTATDGDDVYYEYCNGAELSYKHKNDKEWSLLTYGDDEFTIYTRKNKHPYTDGGVISVNAYAITDSTVTENANGKKITFIYAPSALAASLMSLGDLKSFESSLWLNNDGYCYRLDQRAVFKGEEEESVRDYSLFIDSMNSVEEISKPEAD
ncbi:MAG: hypothetical protein HDT44_02790 [Ruminococcaceae bacterium]|nr:hypothetical protein [Oscillospiraceae bacterium]